MVEQRYDSSLGDMAKHSIIAFAIGAVVTVLAAMVGTVVAVVLRIPGLRALRSARDNEMDNMTSSICVTPDVKPTLSGKVRENEVESLQLTAAEWLQKETGLSDGLVEALVSRKDRLMNNAAEWKALALRVKSMLEQGYTEETIACHLKVSSVELKAPTLDLLVLMVQSGVKSWDVIRFAMETTGYDVEAFEEAIHSNKVLGMDWARAVQRSVAMWRAKNV